MTAYQLFAALFIFLVVLIAALVGKYWNGPGW